MENKETLSAEALYKASAMKKISELNSSTTNLLRGENSLLSKAVDTTASSLTAVKSLAKTASMYAIDLELETEKEMLAKWLS